MKRYSVAVDGPSGAGKSTLSRKAAQALGFLYLDTGAIYRTVAVNVLRQKVDVANEHALCALLPDTKIELKYAPDGLQHMYLNGLDVTDEIRNNEISMIASKISAIGQVREFLLEFQRQQAQREHVIMDGRDIGTVVLPHADVKIFLTADPAVRAKRRFDELVARGQNITFQDVLDDVLKRDFQDTNRAVSPLKQAYDAVLLDTSNLTFEQSLEKILSIIQERIPHEGILVF